MWGIEIAVSCFLGFFIGGIFTFGIAYRVTKLRVAFTEQLYEERVAEKNQLIEKYQQECSDYKGIMWENTELISSLQSQVTEYKIAMEKEQEAAEEKFQLLSDSKESLSEAFKNIANEIFEHKTKTFTEQNLQSIDGLLKPLKERIVEFQHKVEDTTVKNSTERTELKKHIEMLTRLNNKLSEDAHNLTKALRGETKTQGNWGELVLERLLEASGLAKDVDFVTQCSLKAENGKRYQPDVIINLPDDKNVIIDSKVSLKAFEMYCSTDNKDDRDLALRQHVVSLKNHIKDLSSKNYHDLPNVTSVDFVLMFVPIEPAYSTALQLEANLAYDALQKNIVIVTPSSMLATLRTISFIWRQEAQNQNAALIAEKAGRMYDKFVGFVDDLELVGQRLRSTQQAYDNSVNKLHSGKGNLVKRSEELKQLGVNSNKHLAANYYEDAV